MRHDLLTFDLLLAISQSRSLTRGAASVHLALGAASRRVSDLESRLGVELFVRKARGVEPTRACSALLKHVQTVNTALEAFDREASEFSRGVKGFASIAVPVDVAAGGLLREIGEFAGAHPDVHITLSHLKSCEIEAAVGRGDADLGLFLLRPRGSQLQSWPYARGRWVVLVPRGHALTFQQRVSFKDVIAFELIGNDRSSVSTGLIARAAEELGVDVAPRLDANTMEATAALVETGAGIALMTDATAAQCSSAYKVDFVPLVEPWAAYDLAVGTGRTGELPVVVRRLVDALCVRRKVQQDQSGDGLRPPMQLGPPQAAVRTPADRPVGKSSPNTRELSL